MRAVDTNVLVRLIAQDDEDQLAAAVNFVAGGAWVSLLVLTETAWVLASSYDRSRGQVAAAIDVLLDNDSIVLQDADVVGRALAAFRKHPSIGFPDCLIVEQARRAGHLPLGTFDKRLAKVLGVTKV
jgi:predicted nucleic-acid-binding protein